MAHNHACFGALESIVKLTRLLLNHAVYKFHDINEQNHRVKMCLPQFSFPLAYTETYSKNSKKTFQPAVQHVQLKLKAEISLP